MTAWLHSSTPAPVAEQLQALHQQGAERWCPVEFHYAQTLAQRAQAHQGLVRQRLEMKLVQALVGLQERSQQTQTVWQHKVAAAAQRHPAAAAELRTWLTQGQAAAIQRRITALDNASRLAPLKALVAHVVPLAEAAHGTSGPTPARPELNTVRRFRSTWSKFSVDQQLSKDLAQAPRNAGPINSHMLTLRALEAMRDLSPDYLNRFVSYVDTLLFLEQHEQDKWAASAKTPASKRGRKKPAP